MSWTLTADDLPDLARGATLLGTGGGGDPYIGMMLVKQVLGDRSITILDPDELADDLFVIPTAQMGAPTVMIEKIPAGTEPLLALRTLEEHLGRKADATMPIECGGINSMIPLIVAAEAGLPVVDADGMGRAFPELQMLLPTLYGITASPLAISDEKGNTAVLETANNLWTERIARVACVEMGCSVMVAGFAMDGLQARASMVPGSLGHCLSIGTGIEDARAAKTDPVAAVLELIGGLEIFAGKVVDVERGTTKGFARGSARIANADSTLRLSFQNEHLIARSDDRVLATTPDLIMVLDHESGEPITTESLRYGQRVRVLSAPSDPRWHSPEALAMVGPGYFGYDMPSHRFDGVPEPVS